MNNTFLLVNLFIIICLCSGEINSQNNTKISWFNLGVSEAYTESNHSYVNFGSSLNLKSKSFTHQFGILTTFPLIGEKGKFTFNYGIGKSFLIKDILISSLNIGPSLTLGTHKNYDDSEDNFFGAVGITVNTQLYLAPLFFIIPEIAMGIEPYLNYNIYEFTSSNTRLLYGIRFGFSFNSNN